MGNKNRYKLGREKLKEEDISKQILPLALNTEGKQVLLTKEILEHNLSVSLLGYDVKLRKK